MQRQQFSGLIVYACLFYEECTYLVFTSLLSNGIFMTLEYPIKPNLVRLQH